MIFRRPLLIANPGAGPRRRRAAFAPLLDSFMARFPEGLVLRSLPELSTENFFDRYSDRDLLVVYGGDGTVHRILGLSPPSQLPLLVLPGGTGNVLSRYLGIPPLLTHPDTLWDRLPRAGLLRVRPGLAGSRPFLLMAGAGWDGLAVRRIRGKFLLGSLSYYLAGLASLLSSDLPTFSLTLTLENGHQVTRTAVRWCLASRLPPYLGPFRSFPDDRPDLPHLNLTLVCGGRWGIVTAFAGLLPGAPVWMRPFALKVREVVFHPSPEGGEIPFQADGEAIASAPRLALAGSVLSLLSFRVDRDGCGVPRQEDQI